MRLHIHGTGYYGMGLDAPFEAETARIEKVPIKGWAKPGLTRKFGRLAKMSYIAAGRALEHAGIDDPSSVCIVGGTAMGEATVAIDLISQIFETRGKTISPKLVPNSVHNSPVGYLTIGNQNQQAAVVVSEGWLSGEAALLAARDLLEGGIAEKALVVAGDEADPTWATRLGEMNAGDWQRAVTEAAFQECAAAVVLGKEPGGAALGTISVGLERVRLEGASIAEMIERNGGAPGPKCPVQIRPYTGEALLSLTRAALGREVEEMPGIGSAQGGSLSSLVRCITDQEAPELLLLSTELDELSFVHFTR